MQTALITGASSGIGAALAKLFARNGHRLILAARSVDKLEALAQELESDFAVPAHVQQADLARRGSAKRLSAAVRELNVDIDVLVNNAGVMEHGYFTDMPQSKHKRMIDLNISGLTSMLNTFLPGMVERGAGRILNVASVAAFQPLPSLATYAATKAYVLSLTESLAEELAGTGVTVTALCPSFTATPMLKGAQDGSPALKNMPKFLISDVDDVAKSGFDACLRGDVISVPGALNLAATVTGRAMPKWLLRRLSGVVGRYTSGRK
ncbi:MAG: SDR family NAD(P)-dependent oxidoreductase [Gammaproteobacteria bacterium]